MGRNHIRNSDHRESPYSVCLSERLSLRMSRVSIFRNRMWPQYRLA